MTDTYERRKRFLSERGYDPTLVHYLTAAQGVEGWNWSSAEQLSAPALRDFVQRAALARQATGASRPASIPPAMAARPARGGGGCALAGASSISLAIRGIPTVANTFANNVVRQILDGTPNVAPIVTEAKTLRLSMRQLRLQVVARGLPPEAVPEIVRPYLAFERFARKVEEALATRRTPPDEPAALFAHAVEVARVRRNLDAPDDLDALAEFFEDVADTRAMVAATLEPVTEFFEVAEARVLMSVARAADIDLAAIRTTLDEVADVGNEFWRLPAAVSAAEDASEAMRTAFRGVEGFDPDDPLVALGSFGAEMQAAAATARRDLVSWLNTDARSTDWWLHAGLVPGRPSGTLGSPISAFSQFVDPFDPADGIQALRLALGEVDRIAPLGIDIHFALIQVEIAMSQAVLSRLFGYPTAPIPHAFIAARGALETGLGDYYLRGAGRQLRRDYAEAIRRGSDWEIAVVARRELERRGDDPDLVRYMAPTLRREYLFQPAGDFRSTAHAVPWDRIPRTLPPFAASDAWLLRPTGEALATFHIGGWHLGRFLRGEVAGVGDEDAALAIAILAKDRFGYLTAGQMDDALAWKAGVLRGDAPEDLAVLRQHVRQSLEWGKPTAEAIATRTVAPYRRGFHPRADRVDNPSGEQLARLRRRIGTSQDFTAPEAIPEADRFKLLDTLVRVDEGYATQDQVVAASLLVNAYADDAVSPMVVDRLASRLAERLRYGRPTRITTGLNNARELLEEARRPPPTPGTASVRTALVQGRGEVPQVRTPPGSTASWDHPLLGFQFDHIRSVARQYAYHLRGVRVGLSDAFDADPDLWADVVARLEAGALTQGQYAPLRIVVDTSSAHGWRQGNLDRLRELADEAIGEGEITRPQVVRGVPTDADWENPATQAHFDRIREGLARDYDELHILDNLYVAADEAREALILGYGRMEVARNMTQGQANEIISFKDFLKRGAVANDDIDDTLSTILREERATASTPPGELVSSEPLVQSRILSIVDEMDEITARLGLHETRSLVMRIGRLLGDDRLRSTHTQLIENWHNHYLRYRLDFDFELRILQDALRYGGAPYPTAPPGVDASWSRLATRSEQRRVRSFVTSQTTADLEDRIARGNYDTFLTFDNEDVWLEAFRLMDEGLLTHGQAEALGLWRGQILDNQNQPNVLAYIQARVERVLEYGRLPDLVPADSADLAALLEGVGTTRDELLAAFLPGDNPLIRERADYLTWRRLVERVEDGEPVPAQVVEDFRNWRALLEQVEEFRPGSQRMVNVRARLAEALEYGPGTARSVRLTANQRQIDELVGSTSAPDDFPGIAGPSRDLVTARAVSDNFYVLTDDDLYWWRLVFDRADDGTLTAQQAADALAWKAALESNQHRVYAAMLANLRRAAATRTPVAAGVQAATVEGVLARSGIGDTLLATVVGRRPDDPLAELFEATGLWREFFEARSAGQLSRSTVEGIENAADALRGAGTLAIRRKRALAESFEFDRNVRVPPEASPVWATPATQAQIDLIQADIGDRIDLRRRIVRTSPYLQSPEDVATWRSIYQRIDEGTLTNGQARAVLRWKQSTDDLAPGGVVAPPGAEPGWLNRVRPGDLTTRTILDAVDAAQANNARYDAVLYPSPVDAATWRRVIEAHRNLSLRRGHSRAIVAWHEALQTSNPAADRFRTQLLEALEWPKPRDEARGAAAQAVRSALSYGQVLGPADRLPVAARFPQRRAVGAAATDAEAGTAMTAGLSREIPPFWEPPDDIHNEVGDFVQIGGHASGMKFEFYGGDLLFKGEDNYGRYDALEVERASGIIGQVMGLPMAPTWIGDLEVPLVSLGRASTSTRVMRGILQEKFEHVETLSSAMGGRGANLQELLHDSDNLVRSLQGQSVLDYLIDNVDGHSGNYMTDGDIIYGIDKGRTLNMNGRAPVAGAGINGWNTVTREFHEAYAAGVIDMDLDAIDEFMRRVESIDDEAWIGFLNSAVEQNTGVAQRHSLGPIFVARLRGLREEWTTFYKDLAQRRGVQWTPIWEREPNRGDVLQAIDQAFLDSARTAAEAGRTLITSSPEVRSGAVGISIVTDAAGRESIRLTTHLRGNADAALAEAARDIGAASTRGGRELVWTQTGAAGTRPRSEGVEGTVRYYGTSRVDWTPDDGGHLTDLEVAAAFAIGEAEGAPAWVYAVLVPDDSSAAAATIVAAYRADLHYCIALGDRLVDPLRRCVGHASEADAVAHRARLAAASDLDFVVARGDTLLSYGEDLDDLSRGIAFRTTTPERVEVTYEPIGVANPPDRQGRLVMELPTATGVATVEELTGLWNMLSGRLGVQAHLATRDEAELLYWRLALGQASLRSSSAPWQGIVGQVGRIQPQIPGYPVMGIASEISSIRSTWDLAYQRSGQIDRTTGVDIRPQPNLSLGGTEVGVPFFLRPDAAASRGAFRTQAIIVEADAEGLVASHGILSDAERARRQGFDPVGDAAVALSEAGGSLYVTGRLVDHSDVAALPGIGPGQVRAVVNAERQDAKLATFATRDDIYGGPWAGDPDILGTGPRLAALSPEEPHVHMRDWLTLHDDIELLFFDSQEALDRAIAAAEALGVFEIRGLPLNRRWFYEPDSGEQARIIREYFRSLRG